MDSKQQERRSLSLAEAEEVLKHFSGKKNSEIPQLKFKAIPSIQLLQAFNMYPIEQPSTSKKLNLKAARTADLNLEEFRKPPSVTTNTRNVRKQLWSANKDNRGREKIDKVRRGTLMKPSYLKNTICNRTSVINTKVSQFKKQPSKDSSPLLDMDKYTITKIKRTLFPAPQQNSQRKTTSQYSMSNMNKKPLTRKIPKPKIIVTPTEENRPSKTPRKCDNPQCSKSLPDDKIEQLCHRTDVIEKNIKSLDAMLKKICNHFNINIEDDTRETISQEDIARPSKVSTPVPQVTQFENLENKLLNNSNFSENINSSPDDSPLPVLKIEEIVNNTNNNDKLKMKKSQSTSNLTDVKTAISGYNELRDEMKFLATPVLNKTGNLMTPSVQGNEKKLISRRVQEQLTQLNDC